MTETHLQVAETLDGIPQTKKKNPIPGQFDDSMDHDCVQTYTFEVPLGTFAVGAERVIAAHAVVWDMDSETTGKFFSDGDGSTKVTDGNVPAAIYPYSAVDAWEAFDDPSDDTPSLWDTLVDHTFVDADWIWESYRVVDWTVPQDVSFEHLFDVPGYPTGGGVYVATDNMYSASMNGAFLGEQTNFNNWSDAGDYPFDPTKGMNTLEVVGTNYGDSSYSQYSNPAGLIFEGWYTYYADHESAWGATAVGETGFLGKNWATYFTYKIQPVLIETIYVPSDGSVASSAALTNGIGYELRASGTYRFANWGDAGIADAQCSLRPPGESYSFHDEAVDIWVNGDVLPVPYENFLEVWIDGATVDWSPNTCEESEHLYTLEVDGDGSVVEFRIEDNAYGDNSDGDLQVEIWWLG